MKSLLPTTTSTKRKRGEDIAYRVVQDLNDAGLLKEPWTQWDAAQKIVKKAISSRCIPAESDGRK